METGLGQAGGEEGSNIFPHSRRIKSSLKQIIEENVYRSGSIQVDANRRKRLMLTVGESKLPFMTWSAGQREFLPLLLGMYHLLPPGKHTKRSNVELVVIEEPEMGLHPKAIQSLLLLVFELISRDYKVAISTHSPVLLETAWVLRTLKEAQTGVKELRDLFELKSSPSMNSILKRVTSAQVSVYSFGRMADGRVLNQDISSLDPGAIDPMTAEWGGLTSFASRANEIVAEVSSII
jgi:predicted ATP-binding protein involved in virulence